jgi:hypothetical protein
MRRVPQGGRSITMLTIRATQLGLLHRERIRAYEEEVLAYVTTEFPDAAEQKGADETRALVHRTVGKALGYDLSETAAVRAYVSLAIVFGEGFDVGPENSWVRDILKSAFAPSAKLEMILERLGG